MHREIKFIYTVFTKHIGRQQLELSLGSFLDSELSVIWKQTTLLGIVRAVFVPAMNECFGLFKELAAKVLAKAGLL